MTHPTPHQIVIKRLEREQERLQKLLEQSEGLEAADVDELEEIAADLAKLEEKARQVRERIEAMAAKFRDAG